MKDFYSDIKLDLEQLKAADQFRTLKNPDSAGSGIVNVSSNDYLGIARNTQWEREFLDEYSNTAKPHAGFSASSSRLLTGNHFFYTELEKILSSLYNERPALVFNSGYHANLGILPAVSGPRDLILCDKLNHASIIDGIRLSGAQFKRYRHLDYAQLEKLLDQNRGKYEHVFIISESVFSMDGDIADLQRLIELKKRYNAILLVDEAHAVGVFGERGGGVCEEQKLIEQIDVIIGTFGKALCSLGAFAIVNEELRELLINRMRPLIFTTALPPINVAWTSFVLRRVSGMNAEREYLKKISRQLRRALDTKGYQSAGESQIVPLILKENAAAVEKAAQLREHGFAVFAIRPPTVPPGSARLRFSLNAALSENELQKLVDEL